MLITKEVSMDLNYRESPIVMDVQQGDTGRVLRIHFTAGGEPWGIPEDGSIVMQYQCADGSGGMYDSLPDGSPAYSAEENVLTIRLAAQLCAVAGSTKLQVTFFRGGIQISTVYMEIRVAPQLCPEAAEADYTNLGQWLEENGKIGPQGPKGDKGDKGDMGDLTPEAEALRDEMKALSDKTEESAERAEEAAAALEGGLVLRKGEGDDSIVQAITTESGNPNRDNKPIATGFAAVGLGEFNEVSGDNSFACNYVNLVTGNRSFAANEDNKVYGKRSAAFGWKNTIGVNPESPDAPENPEETANIFSCGYQNTLTGRNSFSAGNVNAVKAVNGFAAGKANTLEATAQNGAVFGEQNKVSGYAAFVAGGYNDVAGEYAAALGYKNIVSGGQSFAIGADNEVSGTNDFVGGYNNEVLGDYGFVVGANNIVAKGVQNAAVFGVKNEVPAGGGCVVNGSFNTLSGVYANAFGTRNVVSGNAAFASGQYLNAEKEGQSVFGRYNSPSDEALFLVGNGTSDTDRKNAFEVHDDYIVVGGKTLSAETIGNIGKDKTPELIEITSEENMREKLAEVLDSMDTGTARTIRFEDRGNTFGFNSLYATAYVYKDEFYQDLGLGLYGRLFANIVIETVQGIYHLTCVKILNETYSRWHDWTFPNLQGQKVLRESEIDSKISAIETGVKTEFDTGKISEQERIIQKTKMISVTISDGAATYTTTIAWDSLGLSLDADGNTLADQIWLPFDGASLLIEKETEQATVKIKNTDGGSASIVHLCGVN